jgi:hypothetical protein
MKIRHVISSIVTLCTLPVAAWAGTTLLNENFNELTPGLTQTSAGAFGTIDGTNVDVVGGAVFGSLCAAPEAGNCVDLDGSNGISQGILQSKSPITLLPGVNYFLSFDLICSQRGLTTSTTVNFGPYSETFVLASGNDTSGVVSNALLTVSAPTSAFLTFTSNTPGDVGALLDNVEVTSSAAATAGVPEPATLGLLFLGLAGVGFTRRRRAS